jgi:hypothetical protein
MSHPLNWIPVGTRKKLLWGFLGSTLVLLLLFQPANRPLMTGEAPAGVISLELAWTPVRAQSILESWGSDARLFAAFGLGFDYLFMASYSLALALGSLMASARQAGWFRRLGTWAAYGAILAAVLDALENLGEFQQLFHARVDLAAVVGLCATLKFGLILLVLVYDLAGWLIPSKK